MRRLVTHGRWCFTAKLLHFHCFFHMQDGELISDMHLGNHTKTRKLLRSSPGVLSLQKDISSIQNRFENAPRLSWIIRFIFR